MRLIDLTKTQALNEATRGDLSLREIHNILQMASKETTDPEVSSWLARDETGKWEKTVKNLWDMAQSSPAFDRLSDQEAHKEVAIMVASMALEAALRSRKKRESLEEALTDEGESLDDTFDNIVRKLIVLGSIDALQDVDFDESTGSIYLFLDAQMGQEEAQKIQETISGMYQGTIIAASPSGMIPENTQPADWWVIFVPQESVAGQMGYPQPETWGAEPQMPTVATQQPTAGAAVQAIAQGVDVGKAVDALVKGESIEEALVPGAKFLMRKFALSANEANALAAHPKQKEILDKHEDWMVKQGYPAHNSPLSTGMMLDLMREYGVIRESTLHEGTVVNLVFPTEKDRDNFASAMKEVEGALRDLVKDQSDASGDDDKWGYRVTLKSEASKDDIDKVVTKAKRYQGEYVPKVESVNESGMKRTFEDIVLAVADGMEAAGESPDDETLYMLLSRDPAAFFKAYGEYIPMKYHRFFQRYAVQ